MRRTSVTTTYLLCPECKNVFYLPRKKSHRRENGHIKDLWCFKCKKITKHIEFRHEYQLKEALRKMEENSSEAI